MDAGRDRSDAVAVPTAEPTPSARPLSVKRRIAFALVALTVFLGLFEIGLRVTGYGPTVGKGPPTVTGYFWLGDTTLGWRNRPDGSFLMQDFLSDARVTTEEHGLRDGHGWKTRGDRDLVAMFGDSTTFCAEVDDDDTIASHLSRTLGEERPVAILNAGVRGYSTLQVERAMRQRLEEFPKVRVAVYTYSSNDFVENRMPRIYWPFVAPTVEWKEDHLVDVEPQASAISPGTSAVDFYAEQERQEREARPVWSWWRAHVAIPSFVARKWDDWKERARWERDGHPGEGNRVKWAPWAKETGGDACLRALLARMKKVCDDRGVAFLVTGFASRKDDPDLAPARDACRSVGVRWFDVSGAFTEPQSAYVARHDSGRIDFNHYSKHGAETFAAALAPAIRELLQR